MSALVGPIQMIESVSTPLLVGCPLGTRAIVRWAQDTDDCEIAFAAIFREVMRIPRTSLELAPEQRRLIAEQIEAGHTDFLKHVRQTVLEKVPGWKYG